MRIVGLLWQTEWPEDVGLYDPAALLLEELLEENLDDSYADFLDQMW